MEKLATECGYAPIFRYNPDCEKFTMDSKDVDFSLYDEFLCGENRYAKLKIINSKEASMLLDGQKNWAKKRYDFYKKLDSSL